MNELLSREVETGKVVIHSGFNDLFVKIHNSLRENAVFAVQDDYYTYLESQQKSIFGKLFLVDRADYNTVEIFFDESVNKVDLRDIVDGKPITDPEEVSRFVVAIDKIEILKDQDFMIKAIDSCETKSKLKNVAIEQGEQIEISPKDDTNYFEELQQAKDSDYLRKTVYPLLYPVCQFNKGSSNNRERKTK